VIRSRTPIAFLLALAFSASPAMAEATDIYKQVLPDGTVIYGDRPSPGAKKIQPPASQVVQSVPPSERGTAAPTPPSVAESVYTLLAVTEPTNDEVLWDTHGAVEVAIAVEPALRGDEGDTINILLDGKTALEATKETRFVLSDIGRGTHELVARIESPDGKVLISSEPVIFHVRQHSILFPPPGQPPFQRVPQRPPFPSSSAPSPSSK
jgi:hypothetical protein